MEWRPDSDSNGKHPVARAWIPYAVSAASAYSLYRFSRKYRKTAIAPLGPSSVLYGGDALGAAVNIVLKKPSPDPAYEFAGTAGRWETYRGGLGLTGGLGTTANLLYRFDLGAESATNFRHDASDRLNVTPSFAWRLSSAVQIDARYMLDRNRVSGDGGIPLVPLTGGFVPDPERSAIGDPISRAVQGDGSDFIPRVRRAPLRHPAGLRAGYRPQPPRQLWSDARRPLRVPQHRPLPPVRRRVFVNRSWTSHRRAASTADSVFHAPPLSGDQPSGAERVGASRHRSQHAGGLGLRVQPELHEPPRTGQLQHHSDGPVRSGQTHATVDVHSFPLTRIDYSTNHTNGFFFQDTMTLVPQLESHRRRPVRSGRAQPAQQPGGQRCGDRRGADAERLREVHAPTRTRLSAHREARPLRPEFNSFKPNFTIAADGSPLNPEYGEQYEVGQRLRLMQERLQFSTAVYQVERRNVARNLGGGIYEQIGRQRARGLEAELGGFLTTAWRANVGYGFTKATFLEYRTGAGVGVDLSGNTPRRAPEHTLSLSTSYAWQNGLSVSFGGQFVSSQFINDNNTVEFSPYEILDLGVCPRPVAFSTTST